MRYQDILKAFDPRKILEAYSGTLGTMYGSPFGSFGEMSQFNPKSYFNTQSFFNANDYFDGQSIVRNSIPGLA